MEITIEQIENALEKSNKEHYGLPVVEIDGKEYAVGNEDSVAFAMIEYCKENIQYFNVEFLTQNSKFSTNLFAILQKNEVYEPEVYLELINDIDEFAENARCADGAGHFFASYDGEEIEICNENSEIEYYLYRIN